MPGQLKQLSERHKAIVTLTLRGWTRQQIANAMGMNADTISYLVNTGTFQNELARRQAAIEKIENDDIANNGMLAKEMIAREALPSIAKMAEIRDGSPDQNLQLRASEKILNLAYGSKGPGDAAAVVNNVVMINMEKRNILFEIAREAGVEGDLVGSRDDSGAAGTPSDGTGTGGTEATG